MDRSADSWFALVTCAPRPELGEGVAVAIVFGNGQTSALAFQSGLPRLRGIASPRHIAGFTAMLSAAADDAARGAPVEELELALGPQFRVLRRRQLYVPVSDEVIRRLKSEYLDSPRPSPLAQETDALRRRSADALDSFLRSSVPLSATTFSNASLVKLYGSRLRRFIDFQVPTVARAVRLFQTDVLLEGISLDAHPRAAVVRDLSSRASLTFFAYDTLASRIEELTGRRPTCVGILHHTEESPQDRDGEVSEWVRKSWSPYAIVLEGTGEHVRDELRLRITKLMAP